MSYSSLPNYPVPKRPDPADGRQVGGPCLSPRARRILRDLLLLATIAGLLFQLRQMTLAIERPNLERNLDRVYAEIPHRCDFEQLSLWCRLRKTAAIDSEVAVIREALSDASARRQAWCIERHDTLRGVFVDQPRQPVHLVRWFRLHHPTDPGQWIGIGVFDDYHTDQTERLIIYRVAIGFQPSPA